MKSKKLLPQILTAAIALLFLGGLGIFWPTLVGADSPPNPFAPPEATVADAVTYQGYLVDDTGSPLNGTYTMRFQIYNDQAAGVLLWDSGNTSIDVIDGLFETRLEITTDIFNGEELWVAQTIEGELLTPRQEILPTPMAHTLRPGAVIKGTANAIPNNYTLQVEMNNDVFGFNRGAITGQATTGNAIYGLANNGRAIYGQTQDGYGVYGFDGGSNANQGYAGYFYSTNGVGIYGYSGGDRTHPNIYAPGVYGQSNEGVGVYGRGDTSNSHSFYNQGGYFVGGQGIYALGTDSSGENGYGARIYSDNYRGMYVEADSGFYDAYFGGDLGVSSAGYVDRLAATQSVVINLGETNIEPGDLVAMVGVSPSPETGQPMLAVAKVDATNFNAVIGVAKEAISAQTVSFEDGNEYIDFSPTDGDVAPGSYLVIITEGLAPAVNLSSLAFLTGVQIGDKISLTGSGQMALYAEGADGIVVGKIAGPVDEANETVPLFINID